MPQKTWKTSPLALSVRVSQLLVAWGIPLVVLHMCDFIAQTTPASESRRDLAAVDAFCGQAEITKAFRRKEANVDNFDLEQGDLGNILLPRGFLAILTKVLKLKPKGLLAGGPPCGSWIWINRSTSKRSRNRIFGDCARDYVKAANAITTRFVILAFIAIARGCELLVEQPAGSIMRDYPYMQFLAMSIAPVAWSFVRFPMAAYGHNNRKPTILFGTVRYMTKFARKMTKKDHRRLLKNQAQKKHQMVKKTICKTTGKVQVTGSSGMRSSAAYPRQFGEKVAKCHLSFMDDKKALPSLPLPPPTHRQGPFRFRHAQLGTVKKFLQCEAKNGTYTPLLTSGLWDTCVVLKPNHLR